MSLREVNLGSQATKQPSSNTDVAVDSRDVSAPHPTTPWNPTIAAHASQSQLVA